MGLAPRNMILLGVALCLLVLDLATGRGGDENSREVGPLFPGFVADDVERLAIEAEDAGGVRTRVELVRTSDTARPWRIPAAHDHPAWGGAVDELIGLVGALTTIDLLSEDMGEHARYGVDERGTRLVLSTADGTVLADLVQGDTAPGGRATYVRRFGDDAVYRMARLRRLRADQRALLDTRWMPHEPALVQTIRLRGAEVGEEVVLSRDPEIHRRWTSAGVELPPLVVSGLLTRLAGLHFESVVAAGDAAEGTAQLEIELHLTGGDVWLGRFGAALEDGRISASGTGWTVAFDGKAFDVLRDAVRAVDR